MSRTLWGNSSYRHIYVHGTPYELHRRYDLHHTYDVQGKENRNILRVTSPTSRYGCSLRYGPNRIGLTMNLDMIEALPKIWVLRTGKYHFLRRASSIRLCSHIELDHSPRLPHDHLACHLTVIASLIVSTIISVVRASAAVPGSVSTVVVLAVRIIALASVSATCTRTYLPRYIDKVPIYICT